MGDDFSALLAYRGIDAAIERIITRLESGYEPPELTRVVELGVVNGFHWADRRWRVRWFDTADCETPREARPLLPDATAQLKLQSGFFLAFGADAIWVYHLLRWRSFRVDPRWQEAMVSAVNWFRHVFGATDAVITWDGSWIVGGFKSGLSFDRAQGQAVNEGEREVASVDDLPLLDDNHGWWRPPRRGAR